MNDNALFSNTAGGGRGASQRLARTPRASNGRSAKKGVQTAARAPAGEDRPGPDPQPAGAAAATALDAWRAALRDWTAALGALEHELGEAGPRALGSRWAAAAGVVADVRASLAGPAATAEPAESAPSDRLAGLMAAGDRYEAAAYRLEGAAAAYLDPNVRQAALTGLSHTYSENVRGLARAVQAAAAAAVARQREAVGAAARAGASFAVDLAVTAIEGAFNAAPGRGAVATELYMGALLCSRAPRAAALLGAAKDTALGVPPDSREAAEADARALAEYHPLQGMGYAPAAPAGPAGAGTGAGPPVDLALPQARLAVAYDLGPLLSRRRAQEFGPLAPATSGLNYRLVERLRTIRAEPLGPRSLAPPGPRDEPPVPPAGLVKGDLAVTTDGGRTVRLLAPSGFQPAAAPVAEWAPFAGAHPRVGQRAAAAASLILAQLQADRDSGWSPDLHARYEAAVESGSVASGECGLEAVVNALAAEFERAYDAHPPGDVYEFRDLVSPDSPEPGDYIAAAVSRLGAGALDQRLQQFLAAPNPRIPYEAVEREARLTQLMYSADAARALWLRLRNAYRADPEAFDADALPRRKETLLRLFRRIATEAVAEAPFHCAPPSLKTWAAAEARPGRGL